uniref:Heat shock protein 70 n=1 Tax=Panagrolaimus superbus TaxID=310955 RepID=A0A914XY38_9BILA
MCIFKVENNKIHILHNSADSNLGGSQYDNLLFDYFQKQVKAEFGFDISKMLWSRFIFYCKDIKHVLSFRESYRLYIEDFDATKDGHIDITCKHFEKMAEILLDKTQDFIYETLNKIGIEANQIFTILQTGGGCRMPMIKLLLRQTFPKAKHYSNDYPLDTVAVGAVRYASTIIKQSPESSGTNDVKDKGVSEDPKIDAVGIDLGTTRCCVAVNRTTGIETIGLENEGNRLLPSYVGYDESHEKILGKEFNEIKIDENWTFTLISYGTKVKLQLTTYEGETLKYPEEISTALLKHIKEIINQFQTKELSEVVITVPTAFSDKQKKSTYVAAILAGWKTVHLISEAVAAILAYSIQHLFPPFSSKDNSAILIFDLGGGTLDVSVFKYKTDGTAEIIGRSGDPNLGGRDFDSILVNYFTKLLQSVYKVTVPESKKYFLLSKSQEIKETLSTLIEDSFFVDDIDVTKDDVIKITRKEFEHMSVDLLNRAKEVIFKAINNSGFTADKIDKVIQVGGGSRMPMMKSLMMETFLNAEHCCVTNPDEVVAVGAAHYSFNLNLKNF